MWVPTSYHWEIRQCWNTPKVKQICRLSGTKTWHFCLSDINIRHTSLNSYSFFQIKCIYIFLTWIQVTYYGSKAVSDFIIVKKKFACKLHAVSSDFFFINRESVQHVSGTFPRGLFSTVFCPPFFSPRVFSTAGSLPHVVSPRGFFPTRCFLLRSFPTRFFPLQVFSPLVFFPSRSSSVHSFLP